MAKHKKRDENEEQSLEYDRVKHLEMIQAVIARLANEAALIRGWALTISSALFGFAAHSYSWRVATVGLVPIIAFWGLNSYYLHAERKYRCLYNRVRTGHSDDPYLMDAREESVDSWWRTNFSPTLWPFYGAILLVGAILIAAGVFKLGSAESTQTHTYFLN